MTFRPLLVVALALALVTAGCLGSVQAQSEPADSGTAGPSIGVTATAQVAAGPDLAVVGVAVEATADTADAARGQVASGTDSVRDALEAAGIPADAVRTTSFAVQPRYDYRGDTPELVGYRAAHALAVDVADIDRAGEIVDLAVGNGATRVGGVQFTLQDTTREDLRAQALTDAMTAARADADTVAAAGGLTVTGVDHAATSQHTSVSPGPVFERVASDSATSFSPGPVTVSATVSVTYTAAAN
jgi:uncharacterized protein YggE